MTTPSFTIGQILVLPSSADALAVVQAITRAAQLTLAGEIAVDVEHQRITVAIRDSATEYAAWRQIAPEMSIKAWWVEYVQTGGITPVEPPAPWWAGLAKGAHVKVGGKAISVYSAPAMDAPVKRYAAVGADMTLWAPARADGLYSGQFSKCQSAGASGVSDRSHVQRVFGGQAGGLRRAARSMRI